MVCAAGLEDRSLLATETIGTGPYVLDEAAAERPLHLHGEQGLHLGRRTARPPTRRACPTTVTARDRHERDDGGEPAALGRRQRRDDHRSRPRSTRGRRPVRAEDARRHRRAVVQPRRRHSDVRPRRARRAHPGARPRRAAEGAHQQPGRGRHGARDPAARRAASYDAVSGNVPANDLDAAKAALDEAGWVAGADGMRAKDGTPLSLTLPLRQRARRRRHGRGGARHRGVEGTRRPGRRQAAGRHHHRRAPCSAAVRGTSPGSRST